MYYTYRNSLGKTIDQIDMKCWNIKELFYLVLDFKSMTPNIEEWNEKNLNDNLPRLIRFKRIISLLNVFELINKKDTRTNILDKNEIKSFLRGQFIYDNDLEYYEKICKYLKKNKTFNYSKKYKLSDIHSFFERLIEYRLNIDNVLRFNNSILESMGIGIRVSIEITNKINNEISHKVEEIDKLLFLIMDPNNRNFSEEELIIKNSFPKDDIDDIDMDYW